MADALRRRRRRRRRTPGVEPPPAPVPSYGVEGRWLFFDEVELGDWVSLQSLAGAPGTGESLMPGPATLPGVATFPGGPATEEPLAGEEIYPGEAIFVGGTSASGPPRTWVALDDAVMPGLSVEGRWIRLTEWEA